MSQSSFFNDVYEVVKLIPEGRVTTYGAIAGYLGTKMSARMVGWALNSSTGPAIPAHRVVNRSGLLTGKMYFGEQGRMQELLEAEGIVVKENRVQDMGKVFWDPGKELI
jgi:methylated-DNA-protein-cysteine methyltransferase-like protein